MKVKNVHVTNFGSYPEFSMDFTDEGLALIYGATGSGKSTFMDIVPWILFGTTAKEGNCDEVRSWQAMEEPTTGTATVQTSAGAIITVIRIRGNTRANDLYWTDSGSESGEPQRGRDLADTQRRLEALLACTAETYLASAYFHEFSPTGTFFKDKPKAQRALLEAVAALEFPADLALKASEARKETKKTLEQVEVAIARAEGRLEQAVKARDDSVALEATWTTKREAKINDLATRAARFEVDRSMEIAKLESWSKEWQAKKQREFDRQVDELLGLEKRIKKPEDLDAEIKRHTAGARCDKCQSLPLSANAGIMQLQQQKTANTYNVKAYEQGKKTLQELDQSQDPNVEAIRLVKSTQNNHLEQIVALKTETNPITTQVKRLTQEAKALAIEVRAAKRTMETLERRISSLTQVYDYSFVLRGQMLQRSVAAIEEDTNRYMEKYFDGEIRVGLSIDQTHDSVDVTIQKSGHDCVYRQLSKGQRGLLKLCFGIAVMEAVSNKAGAAASMLMFDESLDGLDESLKIKAHSLFTELASRHDTVYLIDHSPGLQNLLDRRYHIILKGDASEMTLES